MTVETRYAPVAFFCYDRLDTTRETLAALMHNEGAAYTEVYAFCDAARSAQDEERVAAVRQWLRNLPQGAFKAVHIVERPENFGLNKNIISGITQVAGTFGRVIVVEDDIVTAPFFLQYMNNALEEYAGKKEVMMVGGHTQLNIPQKGDVYFSPHAQIWGWATWADRWQYFRHYQSRAEAVEGMTGAEIDALEYHGAFPILQGLDKPSHMWDICWNVEIHKRHGFCLTPTRTLVHNAGMGGGTNYNKWMKYFGHYIEYPFADHLPDVRRSPIAADPEIEDVLYPAAMKDWGFQYNLIGKIVHTLYLPIKRIKNSRSSLSLQADGLVANISTPGAGRGRGPLNASSAKQDEAGYGRGRSELSERSFAERPSAEKGDN